MLSSNRLTAAELKPGMAEKQAAALWATWLHDHGVAGWLHAPFTDGLSGLQGRGIIPAHQQAAGREDALYSRQRPGAVWQGLALVSRISFLYSALVGGLLVEAPRPDGRSYAKGQPRLQDLPC